MHWAGNGPYGGEVRAAPGAWGREEGYSGRNGSSRRQPNYEFAFLTPGASDASEAPGAMWIFC
jgi:hypothetical protein